MRRLMLFLLLAGFVVPAQAEIVEVAGSTTVRAMMEPAADAWHQLHPDVVVTVRGGGSSAGFSSVLDGRAQIGMMSRELEPEELSLLQQAGMVQVRIGFDAVAVVVSEPLYLRGGIAALKKEEIAAIYRGDIRNWLQLDGPDRPILVIDKEKERGTRQVFAGYILDSTHGDSLPEAVVVGPNHDMKTLLQASDQAIGFLPFGETGDHLHALRVIDGGHHYVADTGSVRDGSYPLSRSLYVLHKKDAPAYVQAFVEFLCSPHGQAILRNSGYVPLQ
ncbi:ABC transporter substrate-binding protein [Mariprofundus erugo]|uniref:substrate-binding domain-containing protein n=1 Tax=Mariprofundus erugo TaxID=2528639 RepID=UPI0010FE490E|nr:substrate-binding domain-containing protein [Mariprofundus erugo]TLS78425.1 ABC transporter substrate-binding protein [Mariprofundus erugo]